MRYLFIVNPIAGGGKAAEARAYIKEHMDNINIKYKIVETCGPGSGTQLVLENQDQYDVFVAVGGDGTIKEVAEGIYRAGQGVLGIVPVGTGNDLSKAVKLRDRSIEGSLRNLLDPQYKALDVCMVNGEYYFNVASIGYDAQTIVNYNKLKRIKGMPRYFASVFYTFFNYRAQDLKISIDGQDHSGNVTLIAIGNGQYEGGTFKVLPNSHISDGYLHVCLIKNLSKAKLGFLFPTVFKGRHIGLDKYVSTHKAKNIHIEAQDHLDINLDGEIIEKSPVAEFSIKDKQIQVIY